MKENIQQIRALPRMLSGRREPLSNVNKMLILQETYQTVLLCHKPRHSSSSSRFQIPGYLGLKLDLDLQGCVKAFHQAHYSVSYTSPILRGVRLFFLCRLSTDLFASEYSLRLYLLRFSRSPAVLVAVLSAHLRHRTFFKLQVTRSC